jgi:methanogenic corrinoid protein MtbC1
MRTHSRQDAATRIVFATPSGERHELGTLAAATMAASGGLGAVYLGPDIPASDLLALISTMEADVVVLGITGSDDEAQLADTISSLTTRLPRDVELWLGGAGAEAAAAGAGARVVAVPDFEAFETQLRRIGAQF